MNSAPGRPVRLEIEKIVYPGRRLARREGRVYFTDDGFPGETVEAEILRQRTSFVEARTMAICTPSPRRIPVRCNHYLACGSYQGSPYNDQLELKKDQLREIFRILAPDLAGEMEIVASPREWHYRNRIRFSLRGSGPGAFLAYHEPGSRETFIPTDECFLASERSSAAAKAVRDVLRGGRGSAPGEIEVRESLSEDRILISLYWPSDRNAESIRAIASALEPRFPLAGIVSWSPGRLGKMKETPERGAGNLTERIGEIIYEIGSGSFFQANSALLPLIIDKIKEIAGLRGTESVADIYGGVGTFGLALARRAGRVFVVESFPDNIARLRNNIVRNGLDNVEVLAGPSEFRTAELAGRGLDLVVLDPPRKGLAPEVVAALRNRPAGKILYLSCNPTTLARDIGRLRGRYRLQKLMMFDFFPQTPHIETLAVFEP